MPAPRLAAVLANRKITGSKRNAEDKKPHGPSSDKGGTSKLKGITIDPPRSPKGEKGSHKRTPGVRRKRVGGAKTPGTPNRASARLSAQAQSAKTVVSRTPHARTPQYLEPPVLQSLPVSARRGNRNRHGRKGLFEGGRYRTKTRSFSITFTPLPAERLSLMKRYMLCQRLERNKVKKCWLAAQAPVLAAEGVSAEADDGNEDAKRVASNTRCKKRKGKGGGLKRKRMKLVSTDASPPPTPPPGGLLAALADLSKKRNLQNTGTAIGVGITQFDPAAAVGIGPAIVDMEVLRERKRKEAEEEAAKEKAEMAKREREEEAKEKAEEKAEAARRKAEAEAKEQAEAARRKAEMEVEVARRKAEEEAKAKAEEAKAKAEEAKRKAAEEKKRMEMVRKRAVEETARLQHSLDHTKNKLAEQQADKHRLFIQLKKLLTKEPQKKL